LPYEVSQRFPPCIVFTNYFIVFVGDDHYDRRPLVHIIWFGMIIALHAGSSLWGVKIQEPGKRRQSNSVSLGSARRIASRAPRKLSFICQEVDCEGRLHSAMNASQKKKYWADELRSSGP